MSLPARTAALKAALDALPGAVGDETSTPKGPFSIIYKVQGKTFAILGLRADGYVILKCDPHLIEILKETYAGVGHRSHLDRRHWISVSLEADVPMDEVERLAAGSYDLVCAGLTKKQRAELAALA